MNASPAIINLWLPLLLLLLSRFSRVRLCATPWTAAYQASPSMGFSRQEHWNGLPFPSPDPHKPSTDSHGHGPKGVWEAMGTRFKWGACFSLMFVSLDVVPAIWPGEVPL